MEYWYMFPISIVIATIANSIGIGGATFFSPLFMLALKLPPYIAIGTALGTEVFGFASGVIGYADKKLIDYKLAKNVLFVTVPMAVVGTFLSHYIPNFLLKFILGIGLFILAIKMLHSPNKKEIKKLDAKIEIDFAKNPKTVIVSKYGEEIKYTVCNAKRGLFFTGLGGLLLGMISTGLGELQSVFFLKTCRVPSKISAGTSVLIVAVTALVASISHIPAVASLSPTNLLIVGKILLFTVPGVIIGGQLGSIVSNKINAKKMELVISILFFIISIITIIEVIHSLLKF